MRARICRRLAPDPKNDIVVFGDGYGVKPVSNSPIRDASGGHAHQIFLDMIRYLGKKSVIVVPEFYTSRICSKTNGVLCNMVAPKASGVCVCVCVCALTFLVVCPSDS